ncbi:hypothetical protein PFISCL1PPCAC_11897, partial [Pristionchus fissidentatus]
ARMSAECSALHTVRTFAANISVQVGIGLLFLAAFNEEWRWTAIVGLVELIMLMLIANYCLDESWTKLVQPAAARVGGVLLVAATVSASACTAVYASPLVKLPIMIGFAVRYWIILNDAKFTMHPLALVYISFMAISFGAYYGAAWDTPYIVIGLLHVAFAGTPTIAVGDHCLPMDCGLISFFWFINFALVTVLFEYGATGRLSAALSLLYVTFAVARCPYWKTANHRSWMVCSGVVVNVLYTAFASSFFRVDSMGLRVGLFIGWTVEIELFLLSVISLRGTRRELNMWKFAICSFLLSLLSGFIGLVMQRPYEEEGIKFYAGFMPFLCHCVLPTFMGLLFTFDEKKNEDAELPVVMPDVVQQITVTTVEQTNPTPQTTPDTNSKSEEDDKNPDLSTAHLHSLLISLFAVTVFISAAFLVGPWLARLFNDLERHLQAPKFGPHLPCETYLEDHCFCPEPFLSSIPRPTEGHCPRFSQPVRGRIVPESEMVMRNLAKMDSERQ